MVENRRYIQSMQLQAHLCICKNDPKCKVHNCIFSKIKALNIFQNPRFMVTQVVNHRGCLLKLKTQKKGKRDKKGRETGRDREAETERDGEVKGREWRGREGARWRLVVRRSSARCFPSDRRASPPSQRSERLTSPFCVQFSNGINRNKVRKLKPMHKHMSFFFTALDYQTHLNECGKK